MENDTYSFGFLCLFHNVKISVFHIGRRAGRRRWLRATEKVFSVFPRLKTTFDFEQSAAQVRKNA